MRTYVLFSNDHSISMRPIAKAAARDYNSNIAALQEAAARDSQDVLVSVVKCGHGGSAAVHRQVVNASVTALRPIPESQYEANAGGTPLFDSVLELIEIARATPDFSDKGTSFLFMITTDGEENSSRRANGKSIAAEMRKLIATDRHTFVFRVPRGAAADLVALGIPAGNILEWDQTERGMQQAAQANTEAFGQFMTGRTHGMGSTTRFYADLSDVTLEDVQTQLTDISTEVKFFKVAARDDQTKIREFVEKKAGEPMKKGGAFYQLTKLEPKVQANKRIAIRSKTSGAVFAGDAARQMLALPTVGTVRLAPNDLGDFDVFIQSTSVNRLLDAGTELMYWPDVGRAFKEGPSAQGAAA